MRGVVAVLTEVTERRAMLLERERLLAEAERACADAEMANRAKSEFLTVMSHELRTPLNAIVGHAQLIELGVYGAVTQEQLSALDRIQRSQRHLLGLINGVLNYAKIDAGAVLYYVTDVHVDEALATCEALTAPQARTKRLDLRHVRGDARLTVRADSEKLQQILLNLFSNAIKFTDAGGRVTASGSQLEGSRIAIEVTDTGRGIPADQLDRVFEPFVQIDTKLTRASEGTGLGLAISRELARGMGGELTVQSELGARELVHPDTADDVATRCTNSVTSRSKDAATRAVVARTSACASGALLIPAATLVMQLTPATLIPRARAVSTSGTVDMPTASAPSLSSIRISAGVSYAGPASAA